MTLNEYEKRTDDIAKTIKDLQREKMDITKQYLADNNLNGDVEFRWCGSAHAELGTLQFDYDTYRHEYVLIFVPYTKSGKISKNGRIKILSHSDFACLSPAKTDER